MANVLAEFKKVTTFVFDIDGVLTDGTVLLLAEGLQARQMHVKDGFALQMAKQKGYRVIVISGGSSEESKSRLEYLGIDEVYISVEDKMEFLSDYIKDKDLSWEEILYMGDDLPDIELLKKAGLSTCPADAVGEVKNIVKYISPVNGGWGCVRDVIEKVLKINDNWMYQTEITSK